ncbi:MAG: NrsF family protein [Bacteriovoracia bacterium]
MKSNDLIDMLAKDWTPQKLHKPFGKVFFACLAALLIFFMGFTYLLGFQSTFEELLHEPIFLAELFTLILALLFSSVMSVVAGIPGILEQTKTPLQILRLFGFIVLIESLYKVATSFISGPIFEDLGISCSVILFFSSLVGCLLLYIAGRRGTPTQISILALSISLAGVSTGLLVLLLHCEKHSTSHLAFGHLGGAIAAFFILTKSLNRKLRW